VKLVPETPESVEEDKLRRKRIRRGRFDLRPDQVGTTTHELIAELFVSEIDLDDPIAINDHMRKRVLSYSISHTQSRRLRVGTSVAKYFSRFRRSTDWTFLGAEVHVGDVRLDLLWIGKDGQIQADEVKTGIGAVFGKERTLRPQLEAQVAAGVQVFGGKFHGVRAVLLSRPEESFLATRTTHGGQIAV